MADEPKGPTGVEDGLLFIGGFILLVIIWYFAGGPGKADLRGLFLAPPPPLGSGDAYGPQLGSSTPNSAEYVQAPSPDSAYQPAPYASSTYTYTQPPYAEATYSAAVPQ